MTDYAFAYLWGLGFGVVEGLVFLRVSRGFVGCFAWFLVICLFCVLLLEFMLGFDF